MQTHPDADGGSLFCVLTLQLLSSALTMATFGVNRLVLVKIVIFEDDRSGRERSDRNRGVGKSLS